MLFSEAGQKIFELDRVGAFIWCKLAQGASLEEICQGLGALGIDEQTARQFTRQAVNVWIDRALLEVDWRMPTDCAFSAILGRHRIGVRAANRDLLNRLLPLFCVPDQSAGCDVDVAIEAMMLDGHVFFRGEDAVHATVDTSTLTGHTRAPPGDERSGPQKLPQGGGRCLDKNQREPTWIVVCAKS